jgi:hypothetical protein
MNRRTYASEVTKEYLQKLGIEYVSTDGLTVIKKGKKVNICVSEKSKKPYGKVFFYDPDRYASVPKEERTSASGSVSLDLHVLNYVWNKEDKPEGMVIDHIDNNVRNNDISNLQMITAKENINKDRKTPQRVVRMPKYIDELDLLRKIEGYEIAYEQAKKDHDAKAAHLLRCKLSINRAQYRQYLEEPEKYKKPEKKTVEHDCHARAEKRKELQYEVDRSRKLYKELLEAYGKDDPIVKQYWGEWKLAIAMLQGFKEKHKRASTK